MSTDHCDMSLVPYLQSFQSHRSDTCLAEGNEDQLEHLVSTDSALGHSDAKDN